MVLEKLGTEEVVAIADNDNEKQGLKVMNVSIISPDEIITIDPDLVMVSVEYGFDRIRDFLVEMGVTAEIVHFRDFFNVSPRNTGTFPCDWSKGLKQGDIYDELCLYESKISEMERFFLTGKHNRSFKWLHYFEIYNRHFAKYIGKDINILEIGVNRGGSLQLWKHIFGSKANIYGVDITPDCKAFEDERTKIFIGDQEDRTFWRKIKEEIPKLDILIDDGGHYMDQQIITFEEMFPHVKDDGVYICEDTATSYNPTKYGTGLKKPGTFIEYSKNFIDYIHAWISEEEDFSINEYTKSMHSLHFYFGVLAIEKRVMYPPFDMEILNNGEEKYAKPHLHNFI